MFSDHKDYNGLFLNCTDFITSATLLLQTESFVIIQCICKWRLILFLVNVDDDFSPCASFVMIFIYLFYLFIYLLFLQMN